MAAVARQPFAPLDAARLQTLTSSKNRQNAIPTTSPGKRKAGLLDDAENVDPHFSSRRSKGIKLDIKDAPTRGTLSTKAATTVKSTVSSISVPRASLAGPPTKKPLSTSRRINPPPKTPTDKTGTRSRTDTSAPKPSCYSAPAGRSPTSLSKRSSLFSGRRRSLSSYTRVDPPSFGSRSVAPFSLDAALKGTIPGYGSRTAAPSKKSGSSQVSNLLQPEVKSSWFFDIHEDTQEQEMTNLLQHSTCVLDISSDEETEERASQETLEGRNKENIPPADHVSQVSTRRAKKAADADDMILEKQRLALCEINAADFYPEGCDASSVILVFDDVDDEATLIGDNRFEVSGQIEAKTMNKAAVTIEVNEVQADIHEDIEDAIFNKDTPTFETPVLQPIEGAGESFELWESDSSKDENEASAASS